MLSDSAKRKAYDAYGVQGVQAQEAQGDHGGGGGPGFPPGGAHHPFGGFGGGPGGGPQTTFHFSTGGPPGGFGRGGGPQTMSPEAAEAFFAQFFGHDDPFGGSFAGNRNNRFSDPTLRGSGFGGGPGLGPDLFFRNSVPGMTSTGGIPTRASGGIQRKRYDAIPAGTVVSLKGLVNRPDRNGDRGEVLDYDPASGRYTILIEDSDEQIKVRPHNLLQHVHVKVHGLESQPDLNGLKGTIIAWNAQTQRYNVYVMDRSKVVCLKPGNVILEPGTVGMIMGLNAKPELNGRYGKIKAWVREVNRYEVQLSKDQIVRVKVDNVRV